MTSHQTAAFLIGLGLGATLMLGLVKIGIIAPEANPVPRSCPSTSVTTWSA